MDNATRGALLHDALSRFFTHAAEQTWRRPCCSRRLTRHGCSELAEQSLDEILADARGQTWLGSELLLEPKRLELRRILWRYLRWEMEQNEKHVRAGAGGCRSACVPACSRTRMQLGEIEFDRGDIRHQVPRIRRPGRGRHGRAIRFARTSWPRWTTRPPSTPAPGVGRRPPPGTTGSCSRCRSTPMPRSKIPGARTVRVEYRALKNPKAVHSLELYEFDKSLPASGARPGG